MNEILLVNEKDEVTGTSNKLEVHQKGLLHRAFSVFIYRKQNQDQHQYIEILLQQRHPNKYHSGNLWTNTCCSHQLPNEKNIRESAVRRLKEEMGISTELTPIGVFHYRALVSNNLIENEIDHVFMGELSDSSQIKINTQEVIDYKWLEINLLKNSLKEVKESK